MPLKLNINLCEIRLKQCCRCGYSGSRHYIDEHHVTYAPVKKVHLCRLCHIGITVINALHAQIVGGRLTNAERSDLFKKFMQAPWRMEHEKKPLTRLKRRVNMNYSRYLPALQKYFKEAK